MIVKTGGKEDMSRNLPYLKRDCDPKIKKFLPPGLGRGRNLPYLKRDCDFFVNNTEFMYLSKVETCPT